MNLAPAHLKLKEIRCSTTGCYGPCPIFELTIKASRDVEYDAQYYNEQQGKFKAIIDTATYANLEAIVNYLNMPAMKDSYAVDWTDDQTINLEIQFSDGKIKKISDYGLAGSYGLRSLYEELFTLRNKLDWEKQ